MNRMGLNHLIRVMSVEGEAGFLDAVELRIASDPDMVLHSKFYGLKALDGFVRNSPLDEIPEVILLNFSRPSVSEFEVVSEFCRIVPESRTVILVQRNDCSQAYADSAQKVMPRIVNGLANFSILRKQETGTCVVEDEMTAGGSEVGRFVLARLRKFALKVQSESILSAREIDVLTLLAQGLSKKEIARQLGISYTTVDTHVCRIYQKLNVKNAPAAVNRAYLLKLLSV